MNTLQTHFQRQADFAAEYAPLYAHLFGLVAGWLAEDAPDDELVTWLRETADGQNLLHVSLLLMAGLHRAVLAGEPALRELAEYYPTAAHPPRPLDDEPSRLAQLFRAAILAQRDPLRQFMHHNMVQTNETARGLAWLLPLSFTHWLAVELLDLGASAGLNLVAEQRHFRLFSAAGIHLRDVGLGHPPQFSTICHGDLPDTRLYPPTIRQRTGVDLSPFVLDGREATLTLMSFIWADQPQRLERLREATTAAATAVPPITLHPVTLPDGLASFLDGLPTSTTPLVIYNTYITAYFRETADELGASIGRWASQQPRPVLWLQWEPLRNGRQAASPHPDWCSWTADLWVNSQHHHWLLGWVHPHGTEAHFGQGTAAFATFCATLGTC